MRQKCWRNSSLTTFPSAIATMSQVYGCRTQRKIQHNLGEFIPSLSVGGQVVEKVKTFKLLGTWINENLKWTDNVKHVLLSCYGVLSTLRKIRNLAPQNVKFFRNFSSMI
jgi:hypothetical protein